MYNSEYTSNPTMVLNPFEDSLEAVAIFKSQKDFLDSLSKAIVDAGGNPEAIVRPEITLTELMNTLAVNGVRFWFDPLSKKGSNTEIPPITTTPPVEPESEPLEPTQLPEGE